MPAPRYDIRAGWIAGNWTEIGLKYTWSQIAGNFRWEELAAGPLPNEDVEEVQISRKIGTMFDRLATGECRAQLDNSRGQYTGTGSAQNLVAYSDDVSSATGFWLGSNAATSLNMLMGRTDARDAAALSEDANNATHSLRATNLFPIQSGQNFSVSAEFYPGTRDRIQLRAYDGIEAHAFAAHFSIRSLSAAVNNSVLSGQLLAGSMQVLADGWVRCTIVGNLPTVNGSRASIRMYMVNSAGAVSYTGTGSAWIGVRAISANYGSGAVAFTPTAHSLAVIPQGTTMQVNQVLTIKAVDGSSVYNLFSGYVDEWAFNPAVRDLRKIAISASDVANRLRPVISTSLSVSPTHTTMFREIMSAAGISPLQYSVDQINDIAAYGFVDQVSAGEALSLIQQNGAEVYYVDGAGRLNIRSRHFDVKSTTAVGSYSVGFQMVIGLSTNEVINRAEVRTVPRQIFPDISTVAWLTEGVFVPASTTKQFILDYIDYITAESGVPVFKVQPQIKGQDICAFTDPEGAGGDITSQFNVVASLNATSAAFTVSNDGLSNGYLVICQLMGQPVTKQPELVKTAIDDASFAKYQERFVSVQADMLMTDNRARNLAEFLLVNHSEPKHQITFALKNEWPAVYKHELLDRIFIQNDLASITSSFYIRELEHTLTMQGGIEHTVQMKLEIAPTKNWFTLDSQFLGRMDFNKLGF
jgi:hypothetical protein